MDSARIHLKLVFDETGLSSDLASFSKRLAVQKKIYLSQLFGIDLGYRFGWYLRGPYCPALTSDAFTLRQEIESGDEEADRYCLTEEARKRLARANKLWELPSGIEVSEQDWLELLASLHYLRHIAYRPGDQSADFDGVFESLKRSKPRFTEMRDEARIAWERLEEFALTSCKTVPQPSSP